MNTYDKELKTLNEKLLILDDIDDVIIKSEKSIRIIKLSLSRLKKSINNNGFKSNALEIDFFKNTKPKILSKLIYYLKLFSIESKRPKGSHKIQVKYFNQYIERLQNYFNDNLEFYQYYRLESSSLDEHYFLRNKANIHLLPDAISFYCDDEFSTSHDGTVATIMAYDMLIIYLKEEIGKLENNNSMETNINAFQKQSKLFWTGNKTDLIELIYALHSIGAVNSGTADIKEVALVCEQMFNISLGDYYRTYLEIRSRKINQTKFLDKLKESLIARMESADE